MLTFETVQNQSSFDEPIEQTFGHLVTFIKNNLTMSQEMDLSEHLSEALHLIDDLEGGSSSSSSNNTSMNNLVIDNDVEADAEERIDDNANDNNEAAAAVATNNPFDDDDDDEVNNEQVVPIGAMAVVPVVSVGRSPPPRPPSPYRVAVEANQEEIQNRRVATYVQVTFNMAIHDDTGLELITSATLSNAECKFEWRVYRFDFEALHGISLFLNQLPDRLATALCINREGPENGSFLLELQLELLRHFKRVERRAALLHQREHAMPTNYHSRSVIRAIPYPLLHWRRYPDVQPGQGPTDFCDCIVYLEHKLIALVEMLQDFRRVPFRRLARRFLQHCDYIKDFVGVYLILVHPTMATNKRLQMNEPHELKCEDAERLLADNAQRNLLDQFDILCANYHHEP